MIKLKQIATMFLALLLIMCGMMSNCFHAADKGEKTRYYLGSPVNAGHELTGVCKSPRLNVAAVTAEERKTNDVPAGWYVLEQANIDGIVLWQDKEGNVYQTMPSSAPKKICGSLAEYIALMA